MENKSPNYNLIVVPLSVVRDLCIKYHGYGSVGNVATYAFAVMEGGVPVAAYSWQPPPPGVASVVCPESPSGVLSLSRMVAVPRAERQLQHISKPLRKQMKSLIDRTRWPVLITFSDEGQGHTGHVYKCSGWQQTLRATRYFYVDSQGRRVSSYSNGKSGGRDLKCGGTTTLQRWEHRVCPPGETAKWMEKHGWKRIALPGRVWRSGNQAHTWVNETK